MPNIQDILARVTRDELIDIVSELVAIPSFKGEETPLALHVAAWCKARGYDVELDEVEPGRMQVIATLKGTGGGRSLMFNGHLDINSLTRGWERDPWTCWVEGDRLYGHGAQNMKGGLGTFMVAAEAVRRSGVPLAGDLVLAFVVGETQGGEGMHHLMERGFRTDMAVITEPFGADNIATIHSGIMHFAIHVIGRSGHLSQRENTVHAVNKMALVLQRLEHMSFTAAPYPPLPALPRLNVGSILGGRGEHYLSEPPYVPDMCTIVVDVHFVPGQSVESVLADVQRELDAIKAEDPDFVSSIEMPPPAFIKGRRRLVMEPVDVAQGADIVQSLANSYKIITGKPPAQIGAILPASYSACDTAWLCKAGISAVNYGPTAAFAAAGPEGAYVVISEMETVAKVLVLTAVDVCNSTQPSGSAQALG
ncbi:M20 family metallopeptidase [Pseudomonas typographi]|uniref:M20/M25/M40 family metallo-hydrolase n=1 Tax=Pseudomonas typographi TaxID=2715964 RepID=A0ABR7Z397_9PSED|nr:M20/M25/M40 family metallo-hydrolase [Pseudomonas typographi]MBD1586010.1 M20/M25/M40 family metallo-hydrolase [Pseudomonas typographi]MBD1599868.1 M20/M25/M40 family metallo-hydrolase [Pseudomonas typographi]